MVAMIEKKKTYGILFTISSLCLVRGAGLGAGTMAYFSSPPSPAAAVLGLTALGAMKRQAALAEKYRKAQSLAGVRLAHARRELAKAHERREQAENAADHAMAKADQAWLDAQETTEAAAVAQERYTQSEKTTADSTGYIASLERDNLQLTAATKSSRVALVLERAVSRSLRVELGSSQRTAQAFKARYELAEDRVEQLDGWRFRWGPGAAVGLDHRGNPTALAGLTIMFGR